MSTGVLASFFYYARYDFARLPARVGLILDSGAFSAYTSGVEVDLDDYGRWLTSLTAPESPVTPRFSFNLDVLADAPASLANWRRLKDRHGQITVPVLHYGTHPRELEPYIEEGADRIALGGVATGSGGRQAAAWAAFALRYLGQHHPTIPTHGLGVHMRGALAGLPWDTTDSSSFTSAWRYARMALWIPANTPGRGRWATVDLDGRSIYRHGATLRRWYGTTPEAIEQSTPAKREELVKVATRIEIRAAADWDLTHPRRPVDRFNSSGSDLQGGDVVAHEIDRYLSHAHFAETDATAGEIDRYLVDTYSGHLEVAAKEAT